MKNFRAVPAQGQIDPTACWMACISWYIKASFNRTVRQVDIMNMFSGVWDRNGTINLQALYDGMMKNVSKLKIPAGLISPDNLTDWLNPGFCTIVGFKTPRGTGHMNVLYNYDDKTKQVGVMEPWFPTNLNIIYENNEIPYIQGTAKFTGTHIVRPLTYYKSPPPGNSRLFVASIYHIGEVRF